MDWDWDLLQIIHTTSLSFREENDCSWELTNSSSSVWSDSQTMFISVHKVWRPYILRWIKCLFIFLFVSIFEQRWAFQCMKNSYQCMCMFLSYTLEYKQRFDYWSTSQIVDILDHVNDYKREIILRYYWTNEDIINQR